MSSVYSDKFEGVAFRSGAERARFEADARALWAMKVLLARAAKQGLPLVIPRHDTPKGYWAWVRLAAEALVAGDPSLGEGL